MHKTNPDRHRPPSLRKRLLYLIHDAQAAFPELFENFVVGEDGLADHHGSRLTLSVESNSERYFAIDTKFEGQYQGFLERKASNAELLLFVCSLPH